MHFIILGTAEHFSTNKTTELLQEAIQTQKNYSSLSDTLQACLKFEEDPIHVHSSGIPTKSEVLELLEPLDNWELLANHLPGITSTMINEIKLQCSTTIEKKSLLISNWLSNPEASWKTLIAALVNCERILTSKVNVLSSHASFASAQEKANQSIIKVYLHYY